MNNIIANIITNAENANLAQFIVDNAVAGQIMSMTIKTTPKMNKRNNPYFGRVEKVTTLKAHIMSSYQNAKRNAQEKRGEERTFVSSGMPSGSKSWIIPNLLLEYMNGSVKLQYMPNLSQPTALWYLDGQLITDDAIVANIKFFLPTIKPTDVNYRVVGLENIQQITLNHQSWVRPSREYAMAM